MARFKQVTIVGLGLIGGSLGMALRRRRVARTVVGLSRHPSTLRQAKQRGALDIGTMNPKEAVQDADLVILATPVDTIAPLALRLAKWMRPGSLLTDVGSTKARIVSALERRLPPHIAFVGGHPLAGSEQRGIEAADARLFDGSICVLTPSGRTNRDALKRVARLWQPLVHHVVTMSPQHHDRVLAGTSHLTHLLAACLALTGDATPLPSAPPSFLESTRIAKSDPELWDDIFLTNRDALLVVMDQFARRWHALRTLLARRDRVGLRRVLQRAQSKRDALERA